MTVQLFLIILFLLFMAAEKGVNRWARRPLMNGARWYLVAASIILVIELIQASSLPLPEDPELKGRVLGELVGGMCGAFLLPVGAAIYYSKKFARAKEATARQTVQPNP